MRAFTNDTDKVVVGAEVACNVYVDPKLLHNIVADRLFNICSDDGSCCTNSDFIVDVEYCVNLDCTTTEQQEASSYFDSFCGGTQIWSL